MAPRKGNRRIRRGRRRAPSVINYNVMSRFKSPDNLVIALSPNMTPLHQICTPLSLMLRATVDSSSPPVAAQLKLVAPPYTNPPLQTNPAILWTSGEKLIHPGKSTRFFGRWPLMAWPQVSDKPVVARLEINCLVKGESSMVTVVGAIRLRPHGIDTSEACPAGVLESDLSSSFASLQL